MISVDSEHYELKNFEHQLFNNCIKVDQVLFNLYQSVIVEQKELLPLKLDTNSISELNNSGNQDIIKNWLPTLRNPEDLYLAYTNKYDRLTNTAYQNAIIDLSVFDLPQSLSKTLFNFYISIQLLENPIIQEIDDFVTTPRKFGEVCDYLNKIKGKENENINIKIQWQTLMRWLLYFLPSRYSLSVPNYSEVFYKYQ